MQLVRVAGPEGHLELKARRGGQGEGDGPDISISPLHVRSLRRVPVSKQGMIAHHLVAHPEIDLRKQAPSVRLTVLRHSSAWNQKPESIGGKRGDMGNENHGILTALPHVIRSERLSFIWTSGAALSDTPCRPALQSVRRLTVPCVAKHNIHRRRERVVRDHQLDQCRPPLQMKGEWERHAEPMYQSSVTS